MPTDLEESLQIGSSSSAPVPSKQSSGQAFLASQKKQSSSVSVDAEVQRRIDLELKLAEEVLGGMKQEEKQEFVKNLSASIRKDVERKITLEQNKKPGTSLEAGMRTQKIKPEQTQRLQVNVDAEKSSGSKKIQLQGSLKATVSKEPNEYSTILSNLKKNDIQGSRIGTGRNKEKIVNSVNAGNTEKSFEKETGAVDVKEGVSAQKAFEKDEKNFTAPLKNPSENAKKVESQPLSDDNTNKKINSDANVLENPGEKKERKEDQQVSGEPQVVVSKLKKADPIDASISRAVKEVNMLLNAELMEGVSFVWATALPSFGLSILVGAIIGDFLWAFKDSIVKKLLAPVLRTPELKKQEQVIAKKIRISGAVKANIAGWNLILVFVPIFVIVLVLIVMCNSPTYKIAAFFTDQAEVCKSFDALNVGGSLGNSLSSAQVGSFSCSGQYCTNQWDSKIQQYSQQSGVDACILKTIIQKESAGNPSAIGHDNHDRNSDPFNINSTPLYGLNWNYSHGIGLTQWTIFPNSGSNRWVDAQTPSRAIYGKTYRVTDFLNPDTSLELTSINISKNLQANGNNIKKAFGDYNGSGENGAYAADSMKLYALCKGQ